MSVVFGYSREAVRVKVKKCEGSQQPEFRKFSVDPQITSFEVLQSILAKAFDLKGDFTICYRLYDINGHETYMPLLSDWDLDAAFLKAYNLSEPCLCLRVDLKPFEECSDDWELKSNVPIITQIRTATCQEAKPSPRLHGIINQMGKTLNMVQRAFNFGEDGSTPLQAPRPPLSDSEFRSFLDPVGQIIYAKELRSVIYFGGIDPSLRKVVWKHLLNVYPEGMTGRERMDYIKKKASEYISLRETWKSAIAQGPVIGELAYTTGMVRKDVLRTDRHHPFYAGNDDNQNIASLFNILTTYALNHPKVSYCQGMSDLASPLLVTMNDEAHAYICFCALMQRLCTNFMIDGIAMTQKFTHLAEGLMYYDPEFYNYLKIQQADDLLFCYRWLLLEMKREFAFEDSLRMLEVLWSSLPADPPDKELRLYDLQFQPVSLTPPISPLLKTPRENAYTKVCALRRQSSSMSLNNAISAKKVTSVKRQNHSLDETISKSKNPTSDVKQTKHQSLDDNALTMQKVIENSTTPTNETIRPRSVSPLEPKSDSFAVCNGINRRGDTNLSASMTNLMRNTAKKSGHFKELKERILASKLFPSLERLDANRVSIEEEVSEGVKSEGKKVKNLNEFLNFAASKHKHSDKLMKIGDAVELHPKITFTKSSVDDSESSRHFSSTSNSCCDDIFDEYSPDDSQEYFPLTTSVTRELKIELENLDRRVFGDKFVEKLSESSSTDCSNRSKENENQTDVEFILDNKEGEKGKSKGDDIFIWENPLLDKISPNNTQTPDEQADLDFDSDLPTIVNEISTKKTVTPIKIIHSTPSTKITNICKEGEKKNEDKEEPVAFLSINGVNMTNSCEEITETIRSSVLLPPPNEFGGGNPFLMFLCITVLLQHRDHIINKSMDYNEMAMHFDKMVRKHNVTRVLKEARKMYASYIKQHTIAQQKHDC